MRPDADVPRRNGDPVFDEPWESRAFGMVMALEEAGACDWGDFQRRLVAAVAADPDGRFYERWLTAFEDLLADRELLDRAELERRRAELTSAERHDID